MKQLSLLFFAIAFGLFLFSCSDDDDTDQIKPDIDLSISGAFPTNCDTLYFGETFTMRMRLADNLELGSMSIDIHNNFDHHSHTTEVTECSMAPIKTPVNPFVLIQDISIPEGQTDYLLNQQISIPNADGNGNFDEGDYHLFISLTDQSGWSTQKGLSIKILRRAVS